MKQHHVVWAIVSDQPRLEKALDVLRQAGIEAHEVSALGSYESLEGFGRSILATGASRGRARTEPSPLQWLDSQGVIHIPGAGPVVAAGNLLTALLQPQSGATLQRITDCVRTLVPRGDLRSNSNPQISYILLTVTCHESERLTQAVEALQTVCDSVFPAEAMGSDGPEISMNALETRVEDFAPYPDLYNGSVAQVMDRDIQYVQLDTPLSDAVRAMRSVDAEFFPVVADERMVGLLTNSDVPARHAPAHGSRFACVGDAMIHDFVFCFDDTDVGEAAQIMEKNQVSCIPVLDRLGRLVGMIRSMQSLDASVYEPHLTD